MGNLIKEWVKEILTEEIKDMEEQIYMMGSLPSEIFTG